MSQLGQTEKYSAQADVFRSSSNSGRWLARPKALRGVGAFDPLDIRQSNVMERVECALLNIAGPKGIQPKSLREPYRASGFLMRHRAGPE
jgi:hypothetical protein